MTNLEWVRTLTAEQIVDELHSCSNCALYAESCNWGMDCRKGHVAWLNAERIDPEPPDSWGDLRAAVWFAAREDDPDCEGPFPCRYFGGDPCVECRRKSDWPELGCQSAMLLDVLRRAEALGGME